MREREEGEQEGARGRKRVGLHPDSAGNRTIKPFEWKREAVLFSFRGSRRVFELGHRNRGRLEGISGD